MFTYFAVGYDGKVNLSQHGTDVAELCPAPPARHRARPAHEVVVGVLREADGDDVGLEVDLRHHLEEGDVVFVAELVKVDVRDDPRDPPASYQLIGVCSSGSTKQF